MNYSGKKVILLTALLLISVLTLTLAACGNEAAETESGNKATKDPLTTTEATPETTQKELEYEYFFDEALGGIILTKYLGNSTTVEIPAEIDGKPVVVLEKTFVDNTDIVEVSIPEGVTVIGDETFKNCTALVSVLLPGSLANIGEWTFAYCAALTDVTLPAGLTSMGGFAFSDCTSLTSIAIPAGVTGLYGTFQSCHALRDVRLPEGLIYIGFCTFASCTQLSNVLLPDSLRDIGSVAFSGCIKLSDIVIPDGVTSIGVRFGMGEPGAFDGIPDFSAIYRGIQYFSEFWEGEDLMPYEFYEAINGYEE